MHKNVLLMNDDLPLKCLTGIKVFVVHKIELTSTEHIVCLQIIFNLEIKLDSNLVGWN